MGAKTIVDEYRIRYGKEPEKLAAKLAEIEAHDAAHQALMEKSANPRCYEMTAEQEIEHERSISRAEAYEAWLAEADRTAEECRTWLREHPAGASSGESRIAPDSAPPESTPAGPVPPDAAGVRAATRDRNLDARRLDRAR